VSVEQTIEDMFDCQQQVIAKVSLRGYRFQSVDTVRRIGVGYRNGKWHKGESVYCRLYELIDPDGKTWGNFEDVYSAALAAERLMVERGEIAPFEYEAGQLARRYIEPDAFKLKPENEQ
jgi:hypothetical protein